MLAFGELSALVRALFALWAFLLCLTDIAAGVLAAVQKRFRFICAALILFAPAYCIWQVIFDYSLFGATQEASAVTRELCACSWVYPFIALLVLSALAGWLVIYNIRYDKNYITPGAIKLYLDKMPCGVCCWKENGRVLFSNNCMNELCLAITARPLLNGNQFREALHKEIFTVGTKVWRFSGREMIMDGERLFEMVASDITGEYAKTRALEKDKAELARLNEELRAYFLSIDESVKRQEILQAKMNIHDEMNRLMLSTVAASGEDRQALDAVFALWEQNALMLCMQADKRDSGQEAAETKALAQALGIHLVWSGELPPQLQKKQKELFFFTVKEAIINAVKHAGAAQLEISFVQTPQALICRFENGGAVSAGEVRFAGGLANIELLTRQQGAQLSATAGKTFKLELRFLS